MFAPASGTNVAQHHTIPYQHHLARTSPIPTDPVYADYGKPCKPSTAPPGGRRSPIPKDPTYANPSEYKTDTPKPRVKPEALNIARNHQGRDLAYLFNPAFKVVPIGVKYSHKTPRDHEKENYRKIKEIQKANKERHVESASCRNTPVKAVYKPDKFGHVQSVVAQRIQTPNAPRNIPKLYRSKSQPDIERSKPPSRRYSRPEQLDTKTISNNNNNNNSNNNNNNKTTEHIGSDKLQNKANNVRDSKGKRPSSARNVKENNNTVSNVSKRPPRPSSACEIGRTKKEPLSHIALNKQAVQKTKVKSNPSDAALQELHAKKENDIKNYKRGNVPKYLRNRQNEWKREEEERIANLPDPTVPAGHTVMGEDERLNTLTLLQKSQQDMLEELKTFPVSRDTVRIRQRKDIIERKLTEIDSAMKIFSRPRVFIKDE